MLVGVNIAGAEFGDAHRPGVYDTDYTYPTHAEIDYFAGKDMGVIRMPFLWERLQRTPDGPLNATELARMDDVVRYATSKGLKVILDPHNYGYGFNQEIGVGSTSNAQFADFWGKLAGHFKANGNVIFGLMNEPHDQTAKQWLASANAAIAAIREAGAKQEILVPGTKWDTASLWTTSYSGNAGILAPGIKDPLHNYAFEVHEYLDSDETGSHAGVVSTTIGVERLKAVTQWAEANHQQLFLGEVGVSTDSTSLHALDNMLTYMNQHEGVWQGATYWAAGPWWQDYMFSIEPDGLGTGHVTDKPQIRMLMKHNTDGDTTKDYSASREDLTVLLSKGTADGPAHGAFGHQTFRAIDNALTGSGNDRVYGNAHDNILGGGLGNDVMIGYGGHDTFVFATAPSTRNLDRIVDFDTVNDAIALDRSVFKALSFTSDGSLNPALFKDITNGAKYDANDHILYNSTKGVLYYDADGNGAARPVAFAALSNHPAHLGAGDFVNADLLFA